LLSSTQISNNSKKKKKINTKHEEDTIILSLIAFSYFALQFLQRSPPGMIRHDKISRRSRAITQVNKVSKEKQAQLFYLTVFYDIIILLSELVNTETWENITCILLAQYDVVSVSVNC